MQRKVWKDQRAVDGNRLRLTKEVPLRREPSELTSEPLLDAAVVLAGRTRRKDWVARREFQRDAASIEYTVGL